VSASLKNVSRATYSIQKLVSAFLHATLNVLLVGLCIRLQQLVEIVTALAIQSFAQMVNYLIKNSVNVRIAQFNPLVMPAKDGFGMEHLIVSANVTLIKFFVLMEAQEMKHVIVLFSLVIQLLLDHASMEVFVIR